MAIVYGAHTAQLEQREDTATGRRQVAPAELERRRAWGREWGDVARNAAAAARARSGDQ
jgi:hypothetical protein